MTTLFVPREPNFESRLALTPENCKRLVELGFTVMIEKGCGDKAYFSDAIFQASGAKMMEATPETYGNADLLIRFHPPQLHPQIQQHEIELLKPGALWISFLKPYENRPLLEKFAKQQVTAFAMELVPRISRAQKMDALSSQSNLAGYKAVLLAADHLPKIFPLLMTAAGTINPAKVVVMGAGVAGLQAIATAKRLGAVVEVSDVRPAVKEQVESLGARYIEPPATLQSTPSDSLEDKGGYAKAASAEFLKQQQAITHKHIIVADVVICTALVPGKTAPKLISKETVEAMRPGSVIVDMAVEQGGNCELSQLGKIIRHHDVTIIGLTNLPGMLPTNASEVYSKNILAVVQHLYADQKLNLDLADEINHAAIVTHGSQVLWKPS